MQGQNRLVIHTKLIPPRPPKQTMHRPRLTQRLLEAADYPLTIIHAGAGYGKSTALAALATQATPLVWYHLEQPDGEPRRFLLHLLHGFAHALSDFSQRPLALLEQWEWRERPLLIVDALTNELAQREETVFLVLDDAHVLNETAETGHLLARLINHAPPTLHLLLSTRYPLKLPNLLTLRMRGMLLEIDQAELAFTPAEICSLYEECYGLPLTAAQSALLAEKSEGWAMVLPLVWQRVQRGGATTIPQALAQLSGSAGDLFAYLTQEVLAQQPEPMQRFLRETAVLHQLTPDLCDCVRQSSDSAQMLARLQENGLFVSTLAAGGDGSMRYHPLFRDLLRHQLQPEEAQAIHRRAAHCCTAQGDAEAAIDHFLAAAAHAEAADLLVRHGRSLVATGRLDTLASRIGSLPPQTLTQHPTLFVYLGDVARLHSRFDEALGWYQQAEERCRATRDLAGLGQALRGQARIYLDTVNPSRAEKLLQEALRLADGQPDRESQARLLDLLAENLLNQGRLAEAEKFRQDARALRQEGPGEAALPLRLMLRTGRLQEARQALEAMATAEATQPVNKPRAHRETLLLLSIILAFQGEQEAAYQTAVDGTARGEALESPFITAVGWMRQGHAWLLRKDKQGYEEAEAAFQRAVALSEQLQTTRLKVEAFWGLCQAYGFRGQLKAAEEVARQGIALAQQAGDEWVAACIRTALGAAYVLADRPDAAVHWLSQAQSSFRECSDAHGETVTLLWQCLLWRAQEDAARLHRDVARLLQLVRDHQYEFLFLRRTLLGPPDPRALVPLLLAARQNEQLAAYATSLLEQLDLGRLEIHPGYQLRVQALGPFRLWHGAEEVSARAWSRKKARQLFQLLLTHRSMLMHREQIAGILWPELDAESAQRDFKIAFNAMCRVLEPDRPRNAPSAFVARDGSRYGLRPEADLWFDVSAFDSLIAEGDRLLHHEAAVARERYRQALALYQGPYLQEFPYEEWATQERTRLLNRYLRTAERLARSLTREEAWEEAVDVCHTLLAHDDCWEPAYQMLMTAYARLGNRSQALRTYRRCSDVLRDELGVKPTAATLQVYESVRAL